MENAYLDDGKQYIRLLCTLHTIINCVMTGYGYFCAPRRYWVMPNRWSVYTNGNNKGWTQWPLCTWPILLVVTFVSWVNWLWVSLSGLSVVLAMLRVYFPGSRLLMEAVWCVGVYIWWEYDEKVSNAGHVLDMVLTSSARNAAKVCWGELCGMAITADTASVNGL